MPKRPHRPSQAYHTIAEAEKRAFYSNIEPPFEQREYDLAAWSVSVKTPQSMTARGRQSKGEDSEDGYAGLATPVEQSV